MLADLLVLAGRFVVIAWGFAGLGWEVWRDLLGICWSQLGEEVKLSLFAFARDLPRMCIGPPNYTFELEGGAYLVCLVMLQVLLCFAL
jgi:hypothetical protein